MCEICGCSTSAAASSQPSAASPVRTPATVSVLSPLLAQNDIVAAHNRTHFGQRGTVCINLMSSPGSGKTALIEATIRALGQRIRIGVIEGDLATDNDSRRIRACGVPAIQITTGNACHLDAAMVHDALHRLDLDRIDLLFIENVGNLVCPAAFDLGQHYNVVLLSVTEGDDKPEKYPVMFRAADVLLITKHDLLRVLDDFDPQCAEASLRTVANNAPVVAVSVRDPTGLEHWLGWLNTVLARSRPSHAAEAPRHPHAHPPVEPV